MTVTVRLDEDTEAKLRRLIEQKGGSLSDFVRTAIAETEGEVRCAFYIASADGTKLSHATGMPGSYARCIDGFKIGAAPFCHLAQHQLAEIQAQPVLPEAEQVMIEDPGEIAGKVAGLQLVPR